MRVRYRAAMTWRPMALAIETERLILRLRDERDAAWYRELIAERGEDTPTLEEATTRLARFRDLTLETGTGALAICRRAEGDVIGYCALVVGRCSLDEPEIAYELLRRFHRRGYATEAAQLSWMPRPRRVDTGSGRPCGRGTRHHSGCWRRSASAGITSPRMISARWSGWYATSRRRIETGGRWANGRPSRLGARKG